MTTQIIPPGDTTFIANISDTDYLLAAGTTLDVAGDDAAILIENTADLSTFSIEGTLGSEATGLDYALSSDLQSLGVLVAASGTVIVNSGAAALAIHADETLFENHGLVQGQYSLDAVEISNGSSGGGASSAIVNTGTISGGDGAVNVTADLVSFENSGSISADYVTVTIRADTARISNSGVIEVNFAFDPSAAAIAVTGTLTLENTGQIVAVETAISCATSGGAAADFATIVNSGTIDGAVVLGDGADSFTATSGGVTTGWVNSGNGNDTFRGSYADDLFDGGGDDDKLRGNGGEDILRGGDGNDTIVGNGSADTLDGGAGDDRLNGGARIDSIAGGAGDDTLKGEDGADLLTGGKGFDILVGGNGADVFIFETLRDSSRGQDRDQIMDFVSGSDRIDLSALPESSFIGTDDFSAAGTAELRLIEKANYTVVVLDADGDGRSDLSIQLKGSLALTEADFLL